MGTKKSVGRFSFLILFSNEVQNNDRDHDGLIDVDEVIAGTQINNPDTDGDGLSYGEEDYYGTSPLLQDTDHDGFTDSKELMIPPILSQAIWNRTETLTERTWLSSSSRLRPGPITSAWRILLADLVYSQRMHVQVIL